MQSHHGGSRKGCQEPRRLLGGQAMGSEGTETERGKGLHGTQGFHGQENQECGGLLYESRLRIVVRNSIKYERYCNISYSAMLEKF